MVEAKELRGFLNAEGQLVQLPAKLKKRLLAYLYLAEKFEPEQELTEKEVNEHLNDWHTFNDPATLRRDLYDLGLLERSADGRIYRAPAQLPDHEMLCREAGIV